MLSEPQNTGGNSLRWNTFFAVVFVLVQHKAAPTLTAVASKGVDTLMLAAAILLRALIFVCSKWKKKTAHLNSFCWIPADHNYQWQIQNKWILRGLTWKKLGFEALFGDCVVWFELYAHVIVLRGYSFWFFCSTELPVQPGVCWEPAAYLYVVVLTNLSRETKHTISYVKVWLVSIEVVLKTTAVQHHRSLFLIESIFLPGK